MQKRTLGNSNLEVSALSLVCMRMSHENIGPVNVELTPNHLHEIETAAAKITVEGAHYLVELDKQAGL